MKGSNFLSCLVDIDDDDFFGLVGNDEGYFVAFRFTK
jgi:hypothetical protein